ncbi:MAG: ATP-binding protein [Euryarchaeota archaeon]|nr:ATP-binding protein [Euryarchaeota archaeon]
MDERLLREIQKSNPWWYEKKETSPPFKRTIFSQLLKYLKTKQILAIIGLRRVGKTILMKQLINHQLSASNTKDILFFTFEEQWGTATVLEDILYHFLETIATPQPKFIFLDEIQKVKGWEETIKRFYDRYPDIKFVVSGSASLQITKSVESLAGRIFDVYVAPLSFEEFLEMNSVAVKPHDVKLEYAQYHTLYQTNLYLKEKLTALFSEYLYKGGFPELSKETDEVIIQKYIRNSVIDRILLKDIPEEFPVKNTMALRGIVEYVSRETSGILVLDTLGSILGINKETVSNYVEYLKRAFIIHIIYNYTPSIGKQLRTSKKMHLALPSIAIAMEAYGRDVLLHTEILGKYVESLIAVALLYKYDRIFFWRTPQKDEVDIVVKGKMLIPIEVKYQAQITDSDCKSIIKFCKKFNVYRAIIVTKETLEVRKFNGVQVDCIPAWVFLLGI